MPKKASQIGRPTAMESPDNRTASCKASAARPTRVSSTARGGHSARASLLKKKDPPQSTERIASRSHSIGPMRRELVEGGVVMAQSVFAGRVSLRQ